MKFIGFEREEEAERWARMRLGLEQAPEFFRAMSSVDKNGEFMCVVVMTNFSSTNVDINIAMDGKKMRPKATIEMFNEVFGFLFDRLHVKRATGLTDSDNKAAQKIIEHFGFKLEGAMRKAAMHGRDLMIYGFLAEEYHNHAWRRG